ncbi:MAG: undecaprenyl/decaprenyl-phosphate alpha-N-acetylglucosaminyl 1-phosphate transferase [Lentisphaeraceae bacterium]|nr:undecaprenyl/decaprenyl-phosphate alpha-N-acetylglucosaminyl 1-phosphate transferase [Lentisphaeraceae bacterium]
MIITALTTFVFAFSIGIPLTLIARRMGIRLGLVDQPDDYRKLHKKPMPLSGGYGIYLTIIIVIGTLVIIGNHEFQILAERQKDCLYLLLGSTLMLTMGALDDVYDMRPRYKIIIQLFAASACYIGGFKIGVISIPFGQSLDLSSFSYFVTIFWFLGCMNAINLLDGLDGLVGGLGLFVMATLLINSLIRGDIFGVILTSVIAGSILAFLIFNFNPASIFLGDAGSMLIGFLIAALSLKVSNKAEATFTLLVPFIAIGLPVFDTFAAILRRWGRRVPVSSADRKHIHHVLLAMGFSTKRVVLILYGICILLGSISLLLTIGRESMAMLFLLVFATVTFVVSRIYGVLNLEQLQSRMREDRAEKKRSGNAAIEVEKAITLFSEARRIVDLWTFAKPALEALELDHAYLELDIDQETRKLIWRSTDYEKHHKLSLEKVIDEWSLFLKLYDEDKVFGKIEVWKLSGEMPIRDICYQINKLRTGLAYHVSRLDAKCSKSWTHEVFGLGEAYSGDQVSLILQPSPKMRKVVS